MPGPYGAGTNFYKIDADTILREEITQQTITRAELNQRIIDANDQIYLQDLPLNSQIAQANAMLTILNAP